jgi:ABC-type branched-subunit amino acid transport system permease subunit
MMSRDGLRAGVRPFLALAAIWAALLLAPYWMPPLGGYTALGTRVLVLALAAMSVNFLLGFTGVLSFGHAAYFGLGAYGTGLALKFVTLSTRYRSSWARRWPASPAGFWARSSYAAAVSTSPW